MRLHDVIPAPPPFDKGMPLATRVDATLDWQCVFCAYTAEQRDRMELHIDHNHPQDQTIAAGLGTSVFCRCADCSLRNRNYYHAFFQPYRGEDMVLHRCRQCRDHRLLG